MPECPVCSSPSRGQPRTNGNWTGFDCPRCGFWSIDDSDVTASRLTFQIGEWDAQGVHRRSRLSHILRRRQPADSPSWIAIPLHALESWHLEEPLPTPSEQLDQLIILVGDNQPSPAQSASLNVLSISAWIGATITRTESFADLRWLVEQERSRTLLESGLSKGDTLIMKLNMDGWLRYGDLKRGLVESRTVLMAMKFGDEELDQVVTSCFSPAVKRAGYELHTLIDNQPAGLIDDQLRVALRTSRFLVADLTHSSNGAYWEAGFAEGLGRPVIYTCRETEWKESKSHFDTNHLATVVWDKANLEKAGGQLTAMIRATLPGEARMAD
jgi:hypothetical protein